MPTIAYAPEEVVIPLTGGTVKVLGEVGRGMWEANGGRACPLTIDAVADQAVRLIELLTTSDRCRIRPARAPGAGILRRGGLQRHYTCCHRGIVD